jgi:3-methyladenine DNA glycosylase AlkC
MPKKQEVKTESSAFKHWFGQDLLRRIAKSLAKVHSDFDSKAFLALMPSLEKLEMKPRVLTIRDELRRQLPESYPKALKILLNAVEKGKLSGFDLWPFTEFVQTYGLEHRKISLDALKYLTPLFTAEFAIRPFLRLHPDETLAYLLKCAKDENVHLRRWASEGSRPRLPWGERLQDFVKDPKPTREILDVLKFDPELYVRKSVSNHLNDIAKDHPDYVIKVLSAWKKEAGSDAQLLKRVDWIIHRSLRTLIKAGYPAALKLIGVQHGADVKLSKLKINQRDYTVGDRLEFEFTLQSESTKAQKLVVDYIVHFKKSNQSNAPKVFKLKTVALPAGESLTLRKSHHLKAVTTRVHYAGEHWLDIQVNGVLLKRIKWGLTL